MIVPSENIPQVTKDVEVMICWFNEKPLMIRGKYVLRHSSSEVKCMVMSVDHKININTLEPDFEDKNVKINDIARITLKTTAPIFVDDYRDNPVSGSLILVDEATNETVGAGMVRLR
jgi:sulfate adenylyltransferase subunit 1